MIFTDFVELHGDRKFGDDQALIGGFARLGDTRVMLIGHNKGKNIDENIDRNFGMSRPEGYRKALRLMQLAEKYNLPVVTFIDTVGAFPGLDAEERGQHEAIARNLTEMARLEVPIVVVVTGEGGSGGALGIGVGDSVLMLQYAIYSVISPEGCAGILWRDGSFAAQAAEAMKITARSRCSNSGLSTRSFRNRREARIVFPPRPAEPHQGNGAGSSCAALSASPAALR